MPQKRPNYPPMLRLMCLTAGVAVFELLILAGCGGKHDRQDPPPPAPNIQAPDYATVDDDKLKASVASQTNSTFTWSIQGGTFEGDATTTSGAEVHFKAGSVGGLVLTCTAKSPKGTPSEVTKKIVQVVAAPVIEEFKASASKVLAGDAVKLSYTFSGGKATLTDVKEELVSGGSSDVIPLQNTTYTLTVTNAAGRAEKKEREILTVPAPVITRFSSNWPIKPGEPAILTAEFANGTGFVENVGPIQSGGQLMTTAIKENCLYTLTVTNSEMKRSAQTQALVALPARPTLAVGDYHSVQLKPDGSVWAWGDNSQGQLGYAEGGGRTEPGSVHGLSNIISVAAAGLHNLALDGNGRVWTWGDNVSGQLGDGTTFASAKPNIVPNLNDVVFIDCGGFEYDFSLALKSDGTVWAWGANHLGQLGDGSTSNRMTPVQVKSLTDVVSISAGDAGCLALKSDGTVWAWGWTDHEPMDQKKHLTPIQVTGLREIRSISSGSHSLALKADGTLWAWGENYNGQIGDGTKTGRQTPVKVLDSVIAVDAGRGSNLAIQKNGSLWAWGSTFYDELDSDKPTLFPFPIEGFVNTTKISMGVHGLIMQSNGTLWSVGMNTYGQLGYGGSLEQAIPTRIKSLSNIKSIVGSGWSSFALDDQGKVWTWGCNIYEPLTNYRQVRQSLPIVIKELENIQAIAAGEDFGIALKQGQIWAWGMNKQLVLVSDIKDAVGIACGPYHGLALDSKGDVWSWGAYHNVQLQNGNTSIQNTPTRVLEGKRIKALAGSYNSSIALSENGTIWVWGGKDSKGKLRLPSEKAGLKDIKAIAAGPHFQGAVDYQGKAWWWFEDEDRIHPISGVEDAEAIAVGGSYVVVLDAQNRLWHWGTYHENEPTTDKLTLIKTTDISKIKTLSGGYFHCLALTKDQDILSWGMDDYGQLGLGRLLSSETPQKVIFPDSNRPSPAQVLPDGAPLAPSFRLPAFPMPIERRSRFPHPQLDLRRMLQAIPGTARPSF